MKEKLQFCEDRTGDSLRTGRVFRYYPGVTDGKTNDVGDEQHDCGPVDTC